MAYNNRIMFLEALASGSLILASADTASWCKPERAPVVRVGLQAPAPVGDYGKTMVQLEKFQIDTVSPYGVHVETHVGGLTKGDVEISHTYQTAGLRRGDLTCLWLDQVKVVIRLKQTVYVAKEYAPGTCMYKSVWEHEHKHVRTDREILNKYRPIYEKEIKRYLSTFPVVGPVTVREEGAAQQKLGEQIEYVISGLTEKMESERARRQQGVDTLEEYQRVARMCRGKR